jgi:hypothetical protein
MWMQVPRVLKWLSRGDVMRIVARGFVVMRETAIKSTTGETSTEYVVACVAVAVVVFATYLSLLKT